MSNKFSIQAKKSLGQHFLNSKHVLEQIVDSADIQKNRNILEIGPGTGVLTQSLLEKGAKVIAIEKDTRSCSIIRDTFSKYIESGDLILIEGDVLNSKELDNKLENTSFDLIANIPYYITGAILEKFLENGPRPDKIVLLVQKEVATRIVANDGKESVLSISVKAFGKPRIVAKVPRGAFTPPPTVDSAILTIENINDTAFKEKNINIKRFFNILKAGFAHKRKFLKKNLEDVLSREEIDNIWKKIELDGKIRAEDIKKDTWIDIAGTK